jgi:hypothetical protein
MIAVTTCLKDHQSPVQGLDLNQKERGPELLQVKLEERILTIQEVLLRLMKLVRLQILEHIIKLIFVMNRVKF